MSEYNSFIDFWLNEAGSIVYDYFVFAGSAFILFYIILKRPMWFRKVQKRVPKLSDYGRDILFSLITVTIFATVGLLVGFVWRPYTNMYDNFDQYGMAYYLFTWVWMFFLHDTYFYWMHRLMHQPFLFKACAFGTS